MANYELYGFFTAEGVGKTGLTVTVDVINRAGTVLVNNGAATALGLGFYAYTYTNSTAGDYIAKFKTTDITVDLQEVPAMVSKQQLLIEDIDALVDALALRLTATRAGLLDKLNVAGDLANTDNASNFMADVLSLPDTTTLSLAIDAVLSAIADKPVTAPTDISGLATEENATANKNALELLIAALATAEGLDEIATAILEAVGAIPAADNASIGAIKLKTDNLPAVPAAKGDIPVAPTDYAKASDIPTVTQIQEGLTKAADLLESVTQILTAIADKEVTPEVDVSELAKKEDVPTVEEIQEGLAKEINATQNKLDIIDAIPTTVTAELDPEDVKDILSDNFESIDQQLQDIKDVADSVSATQVKKEDIPTVEEIQEGLATEQDLNACREAILEVINKKPNKPLSPGSPIIDFEDRGTNYYAQQTGMPVVRTRTLLGIDRYARIMGINPLFFNQGAQINSPAGFAIMPFGSGTTNINLTWQQYSWDAYDNVSREQLAAEIRTAENDVTSFLGYYPAPDWTDETIDLPLHYDRTLAKAGTPSIRLDKKKFIAGGVRDVEFVALTPVEYIDKDNDGWKETAVITYEMTSENEIDILKQLKIFLPDCGGLETYEIRPPKNAYVSEGKFIMEFDAWLFITPEIKHKLPNNDSNSVAIDISDDSYLLKEVDLYRVYNRENVPQFYYLDEHGNSVGKGVLSLKSTKVDYVNLTPLEGQCSPCSSSPTQARVLYYSGNVCKPSDNNFYDDLDPVLAKAIAMIATARLERPLAGNAVVTAHTKKLQEDMSKGGGQEKSYRMYNDIIYNNPFGTRYGELLAYKLLVQFQKR